MKEYEKLARDYELREHSEIQWTPEFMTMHTIRAFEEGFLKACEMAQLSRRDYFIGCFIEAFFSSSNNSELTHDELILAAICSADQAIKLIDTLDPKESSIITL